MAEGKGEVMYLPLHTGELRQLINASKADDWLRDTGIREISREEMLDFSIRYRFAMALKDAARVMSGFTAASYSRGTAEEKGMEIISKAEDWSPDQKRAWGMAQKTLLDSIDSFNEFVKGKSPAELRELLSNNSEDVSKDRLDLLPEDVDIRVDELPGVMVVRVRDPEIYKRIKPDADVSGYYNRDLGKGQVRGHVIVLGPASDGGVLGHEYQHFVQNTVTGVIVESFRIVEAEGKQPGKTEVKTIPEQIEEIEKWLNADGGEDESKTGFMEDKLIKLQSELEMRQSRIMASVIWIEYQREAMAYAMAQAKIPTNPEQILRQRFFELKDEVMRKRTKTQMALLMRQVKAARGENMSADDIAFMIATAKGPVTATKDVYMLRRLRAKKQEVERERLAA